MCRGVMSRASKCPFGGMNHGLSGRPFDMKIVGWQWIRTGTRFMSINDRISIEFGSCLELNTLYAINGRWSFTKRMCTIISPLRGMWWVCNHVLLWIREGMMKNDRCPPRVFFCDKICAFLQPRTFVCQVVLHIDSTRKIHGFLLSFVHLSKIFLIGIILMIRLLFQGRGIFLVLLVLATSFLWIFYRIYLSSRKSSRLVRGGGSRRWLEGFPTRLFYGYAGDCTKETVNVCSNFLSSGRKWITRDMGE